MAARHERLSRQGTEIVGFVPVDVPAASPQARPLLPSEAGARIEIELRNGRVLRLSSALPTAELRRLIRVAEQA